MDTKYHVAVDMASGCKATLPQGLIRGGGMSSNLGGGGTFEFSFTMLSRWRFAPPRSHSFTGIFRTDDDKLTIYLTSSSTIDHPPLLFRI